MEYLRRAKQSHTARAGWNMPASPKFQQINYNLKRAALGGLHRRWRRRNMRVRCFPVCVVRCGAPHSPPTHRSPLPPPRGVSGVCAHTSTVPSVPASLRDTSALPTSAPYIRVPLHPVNTPAALQRFGRFARTVLLTTRGTQFNSLYPVNRDRLQRHCTF